MGDLSLNPPAPVFWYKSQRFVALCQSTVLIGLGWLIQAISTNDWTWRPVSIAILGNILLQLKDWFSPGVIGPAAFMNTTVSSTVSASAVASAVKAEEAKKP